MDMSMGMYMVYLNVNKDPRICSLCTQVEAGHTVLIHAAAGGVGSLLCQWANVLGATVIGTVSTKEKAVQAKEDGARHVINYKEEDFVARVNEITSGSGVDVVYDSVGKDTFQVMNASHFLRKLLKIHSRVLTGQSNSFIVFTSFMGIIMQSIRIFSCKNLYLNLLAHRSQVIQIGYKKVYK